MTGDIIASGGAEPVTSAPDIIIAIAAVNDALAVAEQKSVDATEAATTAGELLFDFQSRYLGSQSGDPVLDLNNDGLSTGAFYYNDVEDRVRIYDGAVWQTLLGKVLSGESAPENTDGANGDFWIQTSPPTFYGPKAAGAWPAAIGLGGATPWLPPVAWAGSTDYTIGPPASCVVYNGEAYICTTSHTSTGSFDAAKWIKITTTGTITAANITDSTAAGRALLTAANVAAQKTALSLATIATSGSFADLSNAPLVLPQGRLTLSTGTPVLSADVTGATILYYTPYLGTTVPVWNGSAIVHKTFAELSQAASDATKSPAAVGASKVYDLFVWDDGGTLRLSRGPAWTNDTTRGYAFTRNGGILTNTSSITNGPAAGRGTWVGTAMSNAASTFDFKFGGSASGGSAAWLSVWNLYNRVDVFAQVIEGASSWNYATTTFRSMNNSTGNRVTLVCGAAEDAIVSRVHHRGSTTSAVVMFSGVGLDSTTVASGRLGKGYSAGEVANAMSASYSTQLLGKHYLQALEKGNTNGVFYGDDAAGIETSIKM